MVVILVESLVLKFTLPLMRFEERLPRNTLYDHTQTMLICIFLRKRFKFLKQLKRYHTRVLRVAKNEIIFSFLSQKIAITMFFSPWWTALKALPLPEAP